MNERWQEVVRRLWCSAKAASTVSRHWSRLSHRRSPTAPRWTPADCSGSRLNGVIKRSSSTGAVVHHRSATSGSVAAGSSEQHLGASVTFCSNTAASSLPTTVRHRLRFIGSRGCYVLSDPYCQSTCLCACVCVSANLVLNISETKRFREFVSNREPIGKCIRSVGW